MLETGHALEALGRHDEAIARYTEVAETYPGTEHGRQGLLMAAITYNSLGDTPHGQSRLPPCHRALSVVGRGAHRRR